MLLRAHFSIGCQLVNAKDTLYMSVSEGAAKTTTTRNRMTTELGVVALAGGGRRLS